jgi:hypothetical protein
MYKWYLKIPRLDPIMKWVRTESWVIPILKRLGQWWGTEKETQREIGGKPVQPDIVQVKVKKVFQEGEINHLSCVANRSRKEGRKEGLRVKNPRGCSALDSENKIAKRRHQTEGGRN